MRKDVYLDELIRILEQEKKQLKKTIEEELKMGEYLLAHMYSKGLDEVNATLRVLNIFRDPNKDRWDILAREKKLLTDSLDKYKNNQFMTDYFLDLLNRLNSEIGNIGASRITPFQDTQHIDDALFDISGEVINAFHLIFKGQKFHMKFERQSGNILHWSIGPVKIMRKGYVLRKKNERGLESLGFAFDPDIDRYVYRYDLAAFKDALEIKTLLARVIYDVFVKSYPYETLNVELHRLVIDDEVADDASTP